MKDIIDSVLDGFLALERWNALLDEIGFLPSAEQTNILIKVARANLKAALSVAPHTEPTQESLDYLVKLLLEQESSSLFQVAAENLVKSYDSRDLLNAIDQTQTGKHLRNVSLLRYWIEVQSKRIESTS